MVLSLALLGSGCAGDKADGGEDGAPLTGTGVAPVEPFSAGSRLTVDAWQHGSLVLPYRLRDSEFDQPCEVAAFEDGYFCLPYLAEDPIIGYTDDTCTEPVLLVEDGPVEACCSGYPAYTLGDGPRYALEPLSTEALVAFVAQSETGEDGLTVSWYDGADGAKVWGSVGTEAGGCQILGDVCVPGGATDAYPFNRAFTDEDCTTDAYYPQTGCDGEGVPVAAMNECYERTLLGQTGPEATGTAAQAVALTSTTTSEADLELVRLSTATGAVVDAWHQLSASADAPAMRCQPGLTEDGQVRCVPQRSVMTATDESGGGGTWTSEDVCEDPYDYGEGLYTFLAGQPCSMLSSTRTGGRDEPPEVLNVSEFVPYEGAVYEPTWTDDGYMECPELPATGFWVAVETDATALPALEETSL